MSSSPLRRRGGGGGTPARNTPRLRHLRSSPSFFSTSLSSIGGPPSSVQGLGGAWSSVKWVVGALVISAVSVYAFHYLASWISPGEEGPGGEISSELGLWLEENDLIQDDKCSQQLLSVGEIKAIHFLIHVIQFHTLKSSVMSSYHEITLVGSALSNEIR